MEDKFHLGIKAIIQKGDGKILLLKTNPKQLKGFSGEPYWDIPGGRIKKNSSIEETLLREIEEETGITTIKKFSPFVMVLSKNIRIPVGKETVGLILSSYICKVNKLPNIKISNEHTEYGWFTLIEAKDLLSFKYPKEFVDKLLDLK